MRGEFGRSSCKSHPTGEDVLHYLVERGVITPGSREAETLRKIAGPPPALLGVHGAALSVSRRTLARVMLEARLPSPAKWSVSHAR